MDGPTTLLCEQVLLVDWHFKKIIIQGVNQLCSGLLNRAYQSLYLRKCRIRPPLAIQDNHIDGLSIISRPKGTLNLVFNRGIRQWTNQAD
jgi:hypothetical protein